MSNGRETSSFDQAQRDYDNQQPPDRECLCEEVCDLVKYGEDDKPIHPLPGCCGQCNPEPQV